jgi:hypothetical protein
MQSNIPKLPNDIIFYILKLKRLKEGERIQKSIKNKQLNIKEYGELFEDPYKYVFTYDVIKK